LEKLLSSLKPPGQNKDPSTALAQGLDVMNKVLEKQPHLFIRNNVQQITQVCAQPNQTLHRSMIETVHFDVVLILV